MGTKQFDNYADLITFTRASGATYLDSDGVLKTASTNIPRIEYDADGNRLGLLVEEQRTNLVTYSEEISNRAIWTSSPSGSETANAATAPDESISADYIYGNAAGGGSVYKLRGYTLTASTPYTFSVFAKKADSNWIFIRSGSFDASSNVLVWFDLENGVQGSESPSSGTTLSAVSITPLQNGWYRCSITVTLGTDNTGLFQIGVVSADGNTTYAAGETVGTYLWGAQLETGAFSTSYIPTSGSTATRAADVASIPTSAFGYNASEGTVVVEADVTDASEFAILWSLNDGTTSDRIVGYINSDLISMFCSTGNVEQVNDPYAVAPVDNALLKHGYAFSADNFAHTLNAGAVETDSAGTMPTGINVFEIGSRTNAADQAQINGHVKSIKYYPRRLSNAQLQELTQ